MHSLRKSRFLFFFFIGFVLNAAGQSKESLPTPSHGLVVIAHRGNHTEVPENTLGSFKRAIRAGADYVEVDLRTSQDGHLVVMHDATVDRTTNGKGEVAQKTWAELQKLNIRNEKGKRYRISRLEEVLKICKGKIHIYLDFKDADVAETWKTIQASGMERQVVVFINKAAQYKEWRQEAPQLPLMTSLLPEIKTKEQLRIFLGQVKIEVLDNIGDPEMVATARASGVPVWLDVQNGSDHPDAWEAALKKGVAGLQTDKPEELIAYLTKNGWRNGLPGSKEVVAEPKRSTYIVLKDVKYGDAPGNENVLDAFVPKEHTAQTKLIVYLHGGSWSRGDKSEFPEILIDELVEKRGYAVVSINYRLVKEGKDLFPAQIEDVRKAIQFLSRQSSRYQYDGNSLVLMGGSAGAHLAMLYAYGHDPEKRIKGVIDLWGPTDLTDKMVRADGSDADATVIRFLGEKDPLAQIAKDASPAYHLTKETGVPTLLIHGGADPLVHVSQAENLYKKLQALGIPAQYEVYPNEKHGMSAASMGDVMEKLLIWLEKTYPAK